MKAKRAMRTRIIMTILAMATVAVMLITTATNANAADRRKLGRYVDKIVPGEEYVIESVQFPGMVASPDRREKYKDYITLTKWNPEDPNGCQQIWHFTNMDEKVIDGMYLEQFTRPGMFQMSNFTNYLEHPSKTLRLITCDPKKGYTAKPKEYNSDGSTKDTQWFTGTVLRVENGKTIWKIVGVSSNCRLAPGGWSEVYLREPEWE